ncbi:MULTISPECIES: SDR family oxidoreductase [unclassified Pseudomonas]|uniref:SDR family NAD(P)-dependent oxidoreductase n=1 Tax=unclassified Pseudomonas TaxID=196821 RepID=UPI002AC98F9D|nr:MULTISPECIES: SDR family oxidoreductase [unclassified Pseudomonas]MEB0041531.1 SDR family oxidoreductase [Pseudomonas sp. MH10]MEB0075963.1 SDR family oxidoreductase [Pseudomonas sp. MH10out]MEB0093672.1 SDR family oxidoreductase [Pseudomonas sp. CCI4.2]MEB0101408.1 SDR family oxidoreductase [Pseudomonas sp. CCI3.2]MEB0122557.1 SDR family oxidoreductase [Pseudomonas sp. CCI1.2]
MTTSNTKGTALITGASSGIGFTYADRLAKRGFDLLLVARDQERLETMATRLREETGVKVEVLKADLIDQADLQKVEQRLRTDASISLLLNNAGVASVGTLAESDLGGLDRMIQLNVVALTHLASAAAEGFSKAGRGAIINIASVVPLAPEMFNATYTATKAYVLSLTQSLNAELKESGVRVQAVMPGATRTEIFDRSGMDLSTFPAEWVMDVGEMVDAALAGFDQGELATIPSLPNAADWEAFLTARAALTPNMSLSSAAARFKA